MLTYSNTDIYFASAAKAMHIENNYADYASSIKKAPGETKNKKIQIIPTQTWQQTVHSDNKNVRYSKGQTLYNTKTL